MDIPFHRARPQANRGPTRRSVQGREPRPHGGARSAGAACLRGSDFSVCPVDNRVRTAKPSEHLAEALHEGIAYLETATGKTFGDRRRPLLVSVRSGAAVSMPGMLDTVLDVGCTSAAARGLIRMTGNPGFAWDCRRRFLESYAETVLELEAAPFAAAIAAFTSAAAPQANAISMPTTASNWRWPRGSIADLNAEIPADAMSALVASAMGVCRSWTSEHAHTYRKLQHSSICRALP